MKANDAFGETFSRSPVYVILVVLIGFHALAPSSSASTVITETYSEGAQLYYYPTGNATVITDSNLDPTSSDHNVLQIAANKVVIAPLLGQSVTLSEGTSIVLSFDFLYPTVVTGTSGTAIRFGLFNDQGTAVDSNGTSNASNDYGLWMSASAGTSSVYWQGVYESGTNGTVFYGTDRSYGSTSAGYTLDTNPHHVVLTYSLSGTTASISLSIDGVVQTTYSTTALPSYSFNEIGFCTITSAIEIDNLTIETIPEPQTWAMIVIGVSLFGAIQFYQITFHKNTVST